MPRVNNAPPRKVAKPEMSTSGQGDPVPMALAKIDDAVLTIKTQLRRECKTECWCAAESIKAYRELLILSHRIGELVGACRDEMSAIGAFQKGGKVNE